MTPDTTQEPGLFPSSPPPALSVVTPAERAEFLRQLRERRRRLIDTYAAGLALGELPVPSAVQPLATVQAAIAAVEAELAEGGP